VWVVVWVVAGCMSLWHPKGMCILWQAAVMLLVCGGSSTHTHKALLSTKLGQAHHACSELVVAAVLLCLEVEVVLSAALRASASL
jgi:hypothetical protein